MFVTSVVEPAHCAPYRRSMCVSLLAAPTAATATTTTAAGAPSAAPASASTTITDKEEAERGLQAQRQKAHVKRAAVYYLLTPLVSGCCFDWLAIVCCCRLMGFARRCFQIIRVELMF
ncbi:hypothetical protein M758_UG195400 [Ceratodon purpureus]|nr:hypothetical protein M758_UG195400 [Ceratodon purpureus]